MIGMFFLSSDSMFTSSLHKNSVSFFSSQCRKLLISVRRWIEQFHKQYRFFRQGYRIYVISKLIHLGWTDIEKISIRPERNFDVKIQRPGVASRRL